jgi:arylsulfatase A-like enzyme
MRRALLLALFALGFVLQPAVGVRAETRPNILVIVTDDQRWDQQPLMRLTNQLFGGGGTTFTNAFAETPLCCPSRSSIMTGKYTHNHGVRGNDTTNLSHLDHSQTVQKALGDSGYQTGILGKYFNDWQLKNNPPYFDRWSIMRAGYRNTTFNVDGTLQNVAQYTTDFLSDQGVSMMDAFAQRPDKPWFMYVAPSAPHWPYWQDDEDVNTPVGELRVTPSMN